MATGELRGGIFRQILRKAMGEKRAYLIQGGLGETYMTNPGMYPFLSKYPMPMNAYQLQLKN